MIREQLKQYYRRFCSWQQALPHYVNRHQDVVQHCHNCGTEFTDNFCPRCGQRAEVGRVGWNSIRANVTLLWGLDSRSLSYTLVQVMGRPGYLVRDYISGHRQVSFPPIKMLVLVCLFVVIFESVFDVKNDALKIDFGIQEIDNLIAWINTQKSWATLFGQSFYILPTWLVFRFAPGYPRHTLPEGFFLQVFLSVQSLLLVFFGYWNSDVEFMLWIVYMYITYRQLFGYGWWGTLWRLVVLILLVLIVAIFALLVAGIYNKDNSIYDLLQYALILFTITSLLITAILYVTHRINKKTQRSNV